MRMSLQVGDWRSRSGVPLRTRILGKTPQVAEAILDRISTCSRSPPALRLTIENMIARTRIRRLAQPSRVVRTLLREYPRPANVSPARFSSGSTTPSRHSDLRSQLPGAFSPPPPPPPGPRTKRNLRPYIYATTFLLLGSTAGSYVSHVVAPPALPLPGTPADLAFTSFLHAEAEKLPIVQSLSSDPTFSSWSAYSILSPEKAQHRLTSGPLSGSRGLGGYQQVFHNASTGEIVSVLWIGGATTGWPGVVHGGCSATILDENLGRCAIKALGKSAVTANLEIDYLKPVLANSWVVVRSAPEVGAKEGERKKWVSGRIEGIDGRILVEAKALFVVPKGLNLPSLEGM